MSHFARTEGFLPLIQNNLSIEKNIFFGSHGGGESSFFFVSPDRIFSPPPPFPTTRLFNLGYSSGVYQGLHEKLPLCIKLMSELTKGHLLS